ncbi:hypothetical protein QBC33DRAFT_613416 [Phialemonium atrogriseum]|uniref:Uncharacterized protein n=1 Tax=Phialemonium atrogriseum TaxID=1093897 RepID=A0AAJ0BV67_9PEZI|nr:uncharacterized protein QBC33DRAFT_613416 [Phialemonium atrogriseum]KAK1763983.1 hypothetical protein QBC33DRAFT_613416 [Phialemonium atrogriseum]
MIFKSHNPDINVPERLSLWSWLFDSGLASLSQSRKDRIQGFTDVVTKQHVSFEDLKRHTTAISTAWTALCGLRQGDVIIVYGRNTVWYPVTTLSAVRVGAIACGVSPDYNVEELSYSLCVSKAKFIITAAETADTALEAARKSGIPPQNVILMSGENAGRLSIQKLLQMGETLGEAAQVRPYQIPAGKSNRDICAYLCFSSGTTGHPKAVMISHANIIAQCLQIRQITPSDHDRILAALPFHHITGIVHQLHLPIALDAHVYVLPTYTLDTLLQTVEEYRIKELLIVPPILIRLVRDEKTVSKYDLSHVARFSSGAAPLSREILTLLEKKFPGTGFKQGYGMTESCSAITSHPPSKYAYKYADKVGMVVASTEVRIVDVETGEDCGVGKAGEIWARGPQVAMGYLDNPKATTETFDENGFLHTGDIGLFDEEGLLSITDRMKEMIKVKGIGVAPAELEDLLLGHPSVSDAAVSGIPDDRAGERPKAYVVLKPSSEHLSPEEAGQAVIDFVKSKKARHKWISEVEIVKEIPKSPSGKILRRKLRLMSRGGGGNVVVRDDAFERNMEIPASSRIPASVVGNVSKRARQTLDAVEKFVQETCIPADAVFAQQLGRTSRERFASHPKILEDLKRQARKQGLWNLFLGKTQNGEGTGLTNLEYGLMAEQLGKSVIASEAMNCSAPDSGNMELLEKFGDASQKLEWLTPLLNGAIRSAFLMTEPDIASSDATNIKFQIREEGNEYVLNGSKWWSSGAGDPRCELYIVMGKTDPDDPSPYRQQSVVLVPARTPGIVVHRMLSVFGYDDAPHGHGHITFSNVRVPKSNIVLGRGRGFEIIQGRLGPGRIHHTMRCIGAAERALELVLARIHEPTKKPFGKMLHEHGLVVSKVAQARIDIDSARLVVLDAAVKMDNGNAKLAMKEIASAKVLVPQMLSRILDDAIQVYGGAGVSQDTPLAYMWASARTMRLVDGPDEVHLLQLGKHELRRAASIRDRLGRQKTAEEDLLRQYNMKKLDPLHMGWSSETKPRL